MSNKLTWVDVYSKTDEPDKQGRWARKLYYNDLCIGRVNRTEHEGNVIFNVMTFFPVNGNDSPMGWYKCETYKESQDRLIQLWKEFNRKLAMTDNHEVVSNISFCHLPGGETGIMDMDTMEIFCKCDEKNADIILDAIIHAYKM